ncbi:hypothetical protein CWI66_14750 [Halomonas sp. 141]|nr:hypothetical protein CWI66_14750 [Halomonas sp. 141]
MTPLAVVIGSGLRPDRLHYSNSAASQMSLFCFFIYQPEEALSFKSSQWRDLVDKAGLTQALGFIFLRF